MVIYLRRLKVPYYKKIQFTPARAQGERATNSLGLIIPTSFKGFARVPYSPG